MFTTVAICILAAYSAVMTYFRATAKKTVTTVDDKILAAGEKIEPIVDFLSTKVEAAKADPAK